MRVRVDVVLARALTLWVLCLMWLSLLLPLLVTSSGTVLIGAGAVSLGISAYYLVRALRGSRGGARWWRRLAAVATVSCSAVVGTADIIANVVRYHGMSPHFTREDMVFNSILSLRIHQAGGIDDINNPAFLANLVTSLFYGPGKGYPPLRVMMTGNAVSVALICALASLVGAAYTWSRTQRARPLGRLVAVVAVGWIPFTGVVLGSEVIVGHINVVMTYLVLWLAWILYDSEDERAGVALAWELCATTLVLACWPPVAIIPGVLCVLMGVRWRKALRAQGGRPERKELVILTVSALGFLAFTVGYPLRALASYGEVLGANGGNIGDPPFILLAILVDMLCGLWLVLARPQSRERSLAIVLVFSGAFLGVVYLLNQRTEDTIGMGYYVNKYLLLVNVFTASILAVELASEMASQDRSSGPRSLLRHATIVPALVLVLCAVGLPLQNYGMRSWVAPIHTPVNWAVFAPVEVMNHEDDVFARVFDKEQGGAAMFYKASTELLVDMDRNRFMIQFSAPTDKEVRIYAYTSARDYYGRVCGVFEAWGKDATVYTSKSRRTDARLWVEGCWAPGQKVEIIAVDD